MPCALYLSSGNWRCCYLFAIAHERTRLHDRTFDIKGHRRAHLSEHLNCGPGGNFTRWLVPSGYDFPKSHERNSPGLPLSPVLGGFFYVC